MILEAGADRFIAGLTESDALGRQARRLVVERLAELPGYNWSGFYRLEGEELVLDEYVGATTDHTRIPIGVGVCGTAVATSENQVIDDVRELENYLSCSVQTRSEIVVLVRRGDNVLGQIDIDGHEVGAFDRSDERFLERVANWVAERWD